MTAVLQTTGTASTGHGAVLAYPADAIVVLAGVPGAGKSTLLRRLLLEGADAVVLDPERVAARWQRRLRSRRGYRVYRPLVHAEHWLRLVAALSRPGPVIVHETGTRDRSRRVIAALARRGGHPAHLLLVDVPAAVAREGQHRRGRVVPETSMARHVARARELLARLRADPDALAGEGYAGARIVGRDDVAGIRFGDVAEAAR